MARRPTRRTSPWTPSPTGGVSTERIIRTETSDDRSRWRRKQRGAVRLFKKRLQDFADESGLEITVCHYPPGTRSGIPSSIGCSARSGDVGGIRAEQAGDTAGIHPPYHDANGAEVTATHFEKTYQTGQRVSTRVQNIKLTVTTSALNGTTRPSAGCPQKRNSGGVRHDGLGRLYAATFAVFCAAAVYGIHRRALIAWKIGWVVLVASFASPLFVALPRALKLPSPGCWFISSFVVIGTVIVGGGWGMWWQRQRGYFVSRRDYDPVNQED